MGKKHQSMCCILAGQSPYPERARWLHLARSGRQSQREIRFILPVHGARHIINNYRVETADVKREKHNKRKGTEVTSALVKFNS